MAVTPLRVGIVGCGNISGIYLQNVPRFEILNLVACTDIVMERAKAKADEHGIKAYTPDQMYADPDIDIIINLTPPLAHADVAMRAIEAGKHVYTEKPLAVTREKGKALLEAAAAKGVRVGAAPDTVLGAGIQTCRKLIDDGWIGTPVAATAFMGGGGPESWHPDPEFFYKVGAGPMFDMGPYYVTSLVTLLGPVARVTGSANITHKERLITSQPKCGAKVEVETPTHICGVFDFVSGAVGAITTSFDLPAGSTQERIEIFGTQGTLVVPDPNTHGGPIRIRRVGAKDWAWSEIPLSHTYVTNWRGLGVADMAQAICSGRPHRASGALAFHVLDIMQSVLDASKEEKHIHLTSGVDRPAAMPTGLREGTLD